MNNHYCCHPFFLILYCKIIKNDIKKIIHRFIPLCVADVKANEKGHLWGNNFPCRCALENKALFVDLRPLVVILVIAHVWPAPKVQMVCKRSECRDTYKIETFDVHLF